MLQKKIWLCLLMISTMKAAPDKSITEEVAREALKNLMKSAFTVGVVLVTKKMIFSQPTEEKQTLAVYRQATRPVMSKHYKERIMELQEQQSKHGLTEQQKELLDKYQEKREEIELAILNDKASGVEKPGRELVTTGWLAKALRPIIQILPS